MGDKSPKNTAKKTTQKTVSKSRPAEGAKK
jgi:hypothetical protein